MLHFTWHKTKEIKWTQHPKTFVLLHYYTKSCLHCMWDILFVWDFCKYLDPFTTKWHLNLLLYYKSKFFISVDAKGLNIFACLPFVYNFSIHCLTPFSVTDKKKGEFIFSAPLWSSWCSALLKSYLHHSLKL